MTEAGSCKQFPCLIDSWQCSLMPGYSVNYLGQNRISARPRLSKNTGRSEPLVLMLPKSCKAVTDIDASPEGLSGAVATNLQPHGFHRNC